MSGLIGDWNLFESVLKKLYTALVPLATARLLKSGELVNATIVNHIDKQDLPWTPLKDSTLDKKDNNLIYVESGWLRDNMDLKVVKKSIDNMTIFIGASKDTTHPSGENFADLLFMLEYGTADTPPRPIIRPTWEEVEKKLKKDWIDDIMKLLGGN